MSVDPMIAPAPAEGPRLSVVIPTYNRVERMAQLLSHISAQTLPKERFEVIVVDDGSRQDPRPRLSSLDLGYQLVLERQTNQGPAAARHRGVGLARGEIILFLDDDMLPANELFEEHLKVHDATPRAVVLGHIHSSNKLARLPLFERFHARQLEGYTASLRATGKPPRGPEVCTGNVSMRRADYLAVGGFDQSLGRSEDAELGLKLEESGAALRFAEGASSIHDSDHTDLEGWLERAYLYGVFELRIAHKHPDAAHANPFRYFDLVSPASKPLLALSMAAPPVGHALSRGAMRIAAAADRVGMERLALAGTTLVYGLEYFCGVRDEEGSLAATLRDLSRFRSKRRAARRSALSRFVSAVRADHAMLERYDAKYDTRGRRPASLPKDLVERVGFQMMAAYRLMRLCAEAGVPLGSKVVSRLIRLLYGADIHWDAELDEGVVIVHGMGLAVSHAARVRSGAILSHNVTLGDGIDPQTRAVGAPTVEKDVHIGPGAILLGPITIGAKSKIMPGAVVLRSIPPSSLVESPAPSVAPRGR